MKVETAVIENEMKNLISKSKMIKVSLIQRLRHLILKRLVLQKNFQSKNVNMKKKIK